jgi:hypothetical protein
LFENLVDQSIFHYILGADEIVALSVRSDSLQRLPRVSSQDLFEPRTDSRDLFGTDVDIGGLSLKTPSGWL